MLNHKQDNYTNTFPVLGFSITIHIYIYTYIYSIDFHSGGSRIAMHLFQSKKTCRLPDRQT